MTTGQNDPSPEATDRVEERSLVQLYSRKSGKTNRMVEQILSRAGERGLDVQIVYPEEPLDDQTRNSR